MRKFLYWLGGILIALVLVSFYFRDELVVIGSVFTLKEDVVAFQRDYHKAKADYANKPEKTIDDIVKSKNIGGLIALASSEKKRDEHCRYKRMALENMTNPAIVEGLLNTTFFKDDMCMMNKKWYAQVLEVSEKSRINTLTLLRASGVKDPTASLAYKLNAILDTE